METWAHGQDVVDAVGAASRRRRRRLRHVAHLGRAHVRQQLHHARARGTRRRPCASSSTAPDGERGRGATPRRGRRGPRSGGRLLPRRHAAPSRARHRPRRDGPDAARVDGDRAGVRGPARRRAAPRDSSSAGDARAVSPDRSRPVRIANVSGFYGDRVAAPREMLDGPDPVDVLTGDYLAELTMLILWKATRARPDGRATPRTFVTPDGGRARRLPRPRGARRRRTPAGSTRVALADRCARSRLARGVDARVAVVEGDDLRRRASPRCRQPGIDFTHLDTGAAARRPPASRRSTANAYLGGWGIAAALDAGADVVVCGRVTDAALVVGTGGVVARLGARRLGRARRCGGRRPRDRVRAAGAPAATTRSSTSSRPGYPGFPIAEVAADGSSVITKQPGTGRRGHRRARSPRSCCTRSTSRRT